MKYDLLIKKREDAVSTPSRRSVLKSLPCLTPALLARRIAGQQTTPATMTSNGGGDPYPIPWLDKNGSHNQPAGPNLEPSHIYHFKGLVARCSTYSLVWDRQPGQSNRIRHPDHRLRAHAGRILGRESAAAGRVYPHMTDAVSGAGGSRQSDSRSASSNRAFWAILGGSRAGSGADD